MARTHTVDVADRPIAVSPRLCLLWHDPCNERGRLNFKVVGMVAVQKALWLLVRVGHWLLAARSSFSSQSTRNHSSRCVRMLLVLLLAPIANADQTQTGSLSFTPDSRDWSDGIDRIKAHAARQPNGKLRIGMPNVLWRPPHIVIGEPWVADGKGVDGTNMLGALPVLISNVLGEHDIPWERVPLSNASSAWSPDSSYTACVYDVGVGNADLCVSNFLVFAKRLRLTPFYAPMWNNEYFLILRREHKALTFYEAMARPFRPFSPWLWVAIALLFSYVGITLTYEGGTEDGRLYKHILDLLVSNNIVTAALKGLNAFNTGEVVEVPRRSSGSWLTSLALGFTVLVLVTGYTSVITVTLMQNTQITVSSIDDAIFNGYTFCLEPTAHAPMIARYPKIEGLLAKKQNSADGGTMSEIERMDAGHCTAAIVYQDMWLDERIGQSVHCDTKVRLPETVLSMPVGLPISAEILAPVSYLLSNRLDEGEYKRLSDRAMLNFTSNVCREKSPSKPTTQLDVESMYGPLMFLFIFSTVSLVVTRIGRRAHKKASNLASNMKTTLDLDGDGVITAAELREAKRRASFKVGSAATAGLRMVRKSTSKLRNKSSRELEPPAFPVGEAAGSMTTTVDDVPVDVEGKEADDKLSKPAPE